MKTKSVFISAILLSALCMQLDAQTNEKPTEQPSAKAVNESAKAAQAQPEATIAFDKYKYDFGTIRENDGKVSAVFTFTNLGDSPLIISKVTASCGCAASEWTREPITPGKQGYIKATYDPTNRIYFFNKSLTVYSNGNPSKIVLTIQGTAVKG